MPAAASKARVVSDSHPAKLSPSRLNPHPTPLGGNFASCVALGRNFGATSRLAAPPARAQLRVHTPKGVKPELGAGRGGESREDDTERPT